MVLGDPTLPPLPEDVVLGWTTAAPYDDEALSAAQPVTPLGDDGVAHRLVVLGDSLSHGFKSLAIHDTELSWPVMVAEAMGLDNEEFRRPSYPGPADCPGLPLNVEALLRQLEAHAGTSAPLLGRHSPELAAVTVQLLREVKRYWEHGDGSHDDPTAPPIHNLSIYGWDVRDALTRTREDCHDVLKPGSLLHQLIPHLPSPLTSHDGERAALRVLTASAGEDSSTVGAAERLAKDGIGTLIVELGANNILQTVVKMQLTWTPQGYEKLTPAQRMRAKASATAYRPTHFASDYQELVDRVTAMKARRVVLTTVPHVTVAPLLHGVGTKPTGSRYFARYSRVFVPEAEFDANRDECLSGEACRQIDSAIDSYNAFIVDKVTQARSNGLDWHVFDMCGLLDRLAYRRYYEEPSARPAEFPDVYQLPEALTNLSPWPDTRFFGSDRHGRFQGGLIALDGVHPTTIGYGIVAQEVLVLLDRIGVSLKSKQIDWDAVLASDTMIQAPPRTLSTDLGLLGGLYTTFESLRDLAR